MKTRFSILLAVILCLSPSFVYSQTKEDEVNNEKKSTESKGSNVINLGEVLVQEKSIRPGITTVITEKKLKQTTKNDLLNVINENVPAYYTNNNRIMGFGVSGSGSAKMSIRGVGVSGWGPTTGITMLINGINTTTPVAGHPIADIFSMKNIDRIEILHGPQPVLYGSGSVGGVINVITKKQKEEGYHTFAEISYGLYNTTDDHIYHTGKIGAFDYGVSYNFRYSDGHRDQKVNGTTYDSMYLSNNGTIHLGYSLSSNWYFAIDSFIMDMTINDPGPEDATTTEAEDIENFLITRGGAALTARNKYKLTEGFVQLYGNWGHHLSELPAFDDKNKWELNENEYVIKIQQAIKAPTKTTVTLGTEYKYYGGEATNPDYPDVGSVETYMEENYMTDVSAYMMLEQRLFENKLVLSGGGRGTHNSEYGWFGSWQAGFVVYPVTSTRVFSNIARGFRLPELRQYYLSFAFPDKTLNDIDTDLEPETYTSIEMGVVQQLLEKIELMITAYRIYSQNKFIKAGTFPNIAWQNSDDFTYNGIETTLNIKIDDNFAYSAGYSYIKINDDDTYLPYVPKHKLLSGINWKYNNFTVSINSEYIHEIYEDTAGDNRLDDYFIINSKAGYIFLKKYTAFIKLNNITNNEYAVFERYPMPGFNAMAGVSAEF